MPLALQSRQYWHSLSLVVLAQSASLAPQPQSQEPSWYHPVSQVHPDGMGGGPAAEMVALGTVRHAPPEVAVKLPDESSVPSTRVALLMDAASGPVSGELPETVMVPLEAA